MTIERARATAVPKPWGVIDLRPWSSEGDQGLAIGELWYERPEEVAPEPSLLLKLIFTSQPLSIQVHPDDDYARSIGLARGKSEAWYVVSAPPDGKVGLGLMSALTAPQLLAAVHDGSVIDQIHWRNVSPHDVVVVPSRTIHAIGAGLVIAEIQQRADATFRMFDFDRGRPLHLEHALAVAELGPAIDQIPTASPSKERVVLAVNRHFAFERVTLPARSDWLVEAERETWLLILQGAADVDLFALAPGDVLFAQSDRIEIRTGADPLVCLVAYTGAGGVERSLVRRGSQRARRSDRTSSFGARTSSTRSVHDRIQQPGTRP